ncbi:MAG TPA: helix-turn-helix domain-containing protein, partial [Actinomycetota bacterium]|nr:helix-turn-helix domain-containing protein [Actinomycetota bacterium]
MSTAPRQLLGRAERYESIVKGAAQAFARSGFAATSMEDVAAAAGITKLIVYRHFDSKEELYRAVLERVSDRLAEEFLGHLNRGERTGVGVRSLLTVAREDPDGFVLLFRHASREPQFADYAREHTERAVHAARVWLETVFDDAVLAEWAAQAVVGMNVEAVLAWLEHG